MQVFDWNPEKNRQLIEERGVSFEDVVFSLMHDGLLDDIRHPNLQKYPHQRVFAVNYVSGTLQDITVRKPIEQAE